MTAVVVSREDALRAAAEVLVDAAIRIETEKAIAAARVDEPAERAA